MRTICAVFVLSLVFAVGCGGGGSEGNSNSGGGASPAPDLPTASGEPEVDIGDVEMGIWISAELAPESITALTEPPRVLKDQRGKVNLVSAHVADPAPDKLLLTIKTEPRREFLENPIVIRVHYVIEAVYPGQEDKVVVEKPLHHTIFTTRQPADYVFDDVDVLAELEGTPESIFFQARGTAFLTPKGTDKDSLDAETYEADDPADVANILGNPVRFNFTVPETAP